MWRSRGLDVLRKGLTPSPHLTWTDLIPEDWFRASGAGASLSLMAIRTIAPTVRIPLSLNVTRGVEVSTNTVPSLDTLLSPARLTAVTCQLWRPSVSGTGLRIEVAPVLAICTPSTWTL